MNTSPGTLGQMRAPTRKHHSTDALAPICDINEQCLKMLVEAAHVPSSGNEPFIQQLLALIATLDPAALSTAARFPFLLVDFGFRDPEWWSEITEGSEQTAGQAALPSPFPHAATVALSRSTLMLAWHTVRTDTEASVVLLGITPTVSRILRSQRLQDIDRIAEQYPWRIRPRWEDRPGVWRQLMFCAKSTEVDSAHDFVLHALQLTASAALPKA
jgi:hypothetical protein